MKPRAVDERSGNHDRPHQYRLAFGNLRLGFADHLAGRVARDPVLLAQWLLRRCPVLNDPAIESLAADCAVEAGLPHAPVLLRANHLSGPAVAGLFSPRLLLPCDLLANFSSAELRLMLLHEFAHLRRRDLHLSWLLGVLQAVHWFNPPLRWVFDHLRADCELACDEFVLRLAASTSPDGQGRTYGHALLRLAEQFTQTHTAVSSHAVGQIGMLDGPHNLHRRIVMIAQFNPASRTLSRTWPVIVVGGLLICSGVLLADAVEPSKPKGVEKREAEKGGYSLSNERNWISSTGDTLESLAVSSAQLRVKAAEMSLNSMKAELRRAKELQDNGAGTGTSYEKASAEVQLAEAKVQQEQVNLRVAKVHEKARAALRGEGGAGKP